MSAVGWKKILIMATPSYDLASICSISLTVIIHALEGQGDAAGHVVG
jgi:hypothetical protein